MSAISLTLSSCAVNCFRHLGENLCSTFTAFNLLQAFHARSPPILTTPFQRTNSTGKNTRTHTAFSANVLR